MEGINILNQTEYSDLSGAPTQWMIAFFLTAIIGIFVLFCVEVETGLHYFGIGIALFSLIGVFFIATTQGEKKYEYECTIDENVNVKDMYDNYIVVERRGDIWVLREK